MSLFDRLFRRKSASDLPPDPLSALLGYTRESRAGITVTGQSAIEVTAVMACCRTLMNGVAQVPLKLFATTANGSEPAVGHPLYELLNLQPHDWQTAFEFFEMMVLHLALCGNFYAFINRVGSERKIVELIPIEPARVGVTRNADMSLTYRVSADNGAQQVFGRDSIWHLRGPSWNGWMGLDAVRLARNAIGLAVAIEDQQADFQRNGARTSGSLSVDDKLSPERFAFLSAWLDKHALGGERAGKPLLLDQGAKFASFSMSAIDQQLLDTRKFQIEEICRAFGVMPIMIGQSDKAATYASAEQMFLAHVVHTLSPWYRRIEQSIAVNLLTPAERAAGLYCKFLPNALMRGAAKDRAEFYAKALGSGGSAGWMTQNEVRELEELNRDPDGDVLPQATGKPAPGDNNAP